MSQWPDRNDELFRPTLGADDDAVDFDRPWNPWTMVVLTFFFGLIAGGGLLAFNSRRLGMKGRFLPTLAVVGTVVVLLLGVEFWLLETGRVSLRDRESNRPMTLAVRVISVMAAVVIATAQQKRYRLFQASGLPHGKLLGPALAAIGVSLVYGLGVAALFYTRYYR